MNQSQITLIQQSYAKLVPSKQQAGEIFYAKLFEIAPEVRPLFKENVTEQAGKLMTMLGTVVNGLRDLHKVTPIARKMAVEHVGYGVKPAHYEPVGAALIATLEAGLGEDFTLETREAWVEAYSILSTAMIDAAKAQGAPE
ncbi:globin family protein [Aliiruegeria sabulilitoris]|uniref:globin family protein n=1 Tax=Aliiruegeria sabulilitoris TaxID=1510458 RepID=UPI0008326626|nr:globin family protein [Aliiruegeria sabulilitoris]NDR56139.1 hemin receptor [Pseudoruegeria sp. M32A2M]